MDGLDSLLLSRIQFGANITFHILFPTITISLAWILLFFKLCYNKTGDEKWKESYKFFVKVFALCFALGVVSGVTMSFQFGTNWPGFMKTVGNIAGPLLAYEVLTAFFLEATFLGIMLFGWKRVSNGIHTLATVLVAIGTSMSALWILVLNSWMHTPAGFEMIDGVAYATNWFEIIFNPSMPYRLSHMLLACGLTSAFLISGLSAYQWIRNDRRPSVLASMKTGLFLGAILIPIQIFAGDMHGLNTLKYQPQKVAAMEGIWETEKGAALRLFAIPDQKERKNHLEVKIPYLGSLILTHSFDGEIKGLNEFKYIPPVAPVFFAFRIMVGTGVLMLLISWLGTIQIYRKSYPSKLLCYVLLCMTFSGWIGTVAGWYTTEMGRQPWLVQGVLMTKDAVSQVPASMVAGTLTAYLASYVVLLTIFIATLFYLARKASSANKYKSQNYQGTLRNTY